MTFNASRLQNGFCHTTSVSTSATSNNHFVFVFQLSGFVFDVI
jgi:hypothetical protein